ncbi:hypothetical protein EIN_131500, partial [Entamoeba invadens IP1]
MSFKPLKLIRLDPPHLLWVIPHLTSISVLQRFHQVSRNCGESISRLKVNPCYQELSLETILQNDHSIHIRKELQIFTGIDSLHTDINTLQQLPPELLSNVKLFEISFIQKQTPSSYPIWEIIKDRVSRLIIDAQIIALIDLTALPNLRRLEIKAGRVALNENLPIRQIENLQTLVIFCDGNLYKNYFDLFEQFVCSKLRVLYKLNWPVDVIKHNPQCLQKVQSSQNLKGVLNLEEVYTPKKSPKTMNYQNYQNEQIHDVPNSSIALGNTNTHESSNFVSTEFHSKIIVLDFLKKRFDFPMDMFKEVSLSTQSSSIIDILSGLDLKEKAIVYIHEDIEESQVILNIVNQKENIIIILPKEKYIYKQFAKENCQVKNSRVAESFEEQISRLIDQAEWKGRDEEIIKHVIEMHSTKKQVGYINKSNKHLVASNYKEIIRKFVGLCQERTPLDRSISSVLEKLENFPIESESIEKLQTSINNSFTIVELVVVEIINCFEYLSVLSVGFSHNLLRIALSALQTNSPSQSFSVNDYLNENVLYCLCLIIQSLPRVCISEDVSQLFGSIQIEVDHINQLELKGTAELTEFMKYISQLQVDLFKITLLLDCSKRFSFEFFSIHHRLNFIVLSLCNTSTTSAQISI